MLPRSSTTARPLYIGMQGAITDLACAILMEPRICERMTCIWIGGADYPEGGEEFNLMSDINAANVVLSSSMPLWQVPTGTWTLAGDSYVTELNGNLAKVNMNGYTLYVNGAAQL